MSSASNEANDKFDDDGRPKRTGTTWTASAHIVTSVIGSGVLSLSWANAQLGWIAGPIVLWAFAVITLFTSILLADCYRGPSGTRNYVYKDAVRSYLGGLKVQLCGIVQYSNLVGLTIGYSITTAISMVAIKKSNCFHEHGHEWDCSMSNNPWIVYFGLVQIVLSQVPNFHELAFISFIAAIMSFAYSTIAVGLSIAKIAEEGAGKSSITGIPVSDKYSSMDKMWSIFTALGNIAFAFGFSIILIEIQDTLKAGVPENKVMKQATLLGISVSTSFYMLCGFLGYAAFGHDAPGNFLTGFGFYEPFWLVDIANICIVLHIVGAYQVFCQPIFAAIEKWSREKWVENKFVTREYPVSFPLCGRRCFNLSLFRLVSRTCYVVLTTVLAMLFPFFNDFLGLIGAVSFWPLTVYFPIEMYISRSKTPKFSLAWIGLQLLIAICLVVSILAAAGSIRGIIHSLQAYKPFQSRS